MLESFAGDSVLVPGKLAVKASRDPDDDKFLAAAIEAKARYIVTGDKDLLDVKSYRRVRMIRPRAFLKILQESRRSRKKLTYN